MLYDYVQKIMHHFTIDTIISLNNIDINFILIIALILACIYEFINGFHDTANSIATVIYTYALQPQVAVIMSSIFNFLGVILSGLSVAYTIIYLIPIDILINTNSIKYLTMIFAILLSAIIWNIGTWYLGLPASSSHTLIGTIIGIGIINAFNTNNPITKTLNIPKLIEIIISLIISPLIGGILAGSIILMLFFFLNNKKKIHNIHLTPSEKEQKDGKKYPLFWPRITLILSAAGVSFSHGANDGQKGIGLIMLILIGVTPGNFVVNLNANKQEIQCTHHAIYHLQQYYNENLKKIISRFEKDNKYYQIHPKINNKNTPQYQNIISFKEKEKNSIKNTTNKNLNNYLNEIKKPKSQQELLTTNHENNTISINIHIALQLFEKIEDYNLLCIEERLKIRNILIYLADITEKISKIPEIKTIDKQMLYELRKDLLITIEYAPLWIIIIVALSLSFGTIIGWRRVSITIGKKIGKKEMTYAQGLSAQLATGISISIASYSGIPMSTTHVLSSAVTGTMIIQGYKLQNKTIKNILLTWILTLPIAILLSSIMYWLFLKLF